METWDAIRSRRNVRDYRPDPVPEADLLRIAEAGWRAPSASRSVTIAVATRQQLAHAVQSICSSISSAMRLRIRSE